MTSYANLLGQIRLENQYSERLSDLQAKLLTLTELREQLEVVLDWVTTDLSGLKLSQTQLKEVLKSVMDTVDQFEGIDVYSAVGFAHKEDSEKELLSKEVGMDSSGQPYDVYVTKDSYDGDDENEIFITFYVVKRN